MILILDTSSSYAAVSMRRLGPNGRHRWTTILQCCALVQIGEARCHRALMEIVRWGAFGFEAQRLDAAKLYRYDSLLVLQDPFTNK